MFSDFFRQIKLAIFSPQGKLVLKSTVFALGWLYLPFWAFLFLAAYFYFRPFFRPARLAVPFIILLYFAATEPRGIWMAVLFSALFYLIVGIKDFVIIDRRSVHEVLVLLLIFLLLGRFYSSVSGWDSGAAAFGALGVGAIVFLLSRGVFGARSSGGVQVLGDAAAASKTMVAPLLLALISAELILAVLFLPLSFLYQAAAALVMITVLFEITADFLCGRYERRKLLANLSVGLVFLAIILGSAQWTL